MVKLVPGFLKKIIVQKGTGAEHDGFRRGESSESTSSSAAGVAVDRSRVVSALEAPGSREGADHTAEEDVFQKDDSFEHGITSNIATIALSDWGYPVYDDSREEGIFSGKYLTGLLRNCVPSGDPLEDFIGASRTKLVPKVEESDFAEYIRQVSVFYATMNEEPSLSEGAGGTNSSGAPSETHVSKEYYSEDYVVANNDVFREELDHIPAVMSSLEAQLEAVNGELQEMLERRYAHVHEACTSVEELHTRFLDVTKQIDRIRADLEGEAARAAATQDESSAAAPIEKEELDDVLKSGIARKKDLQIMLGYLQMLRAITSIPEYIQGIADSNGIAIANIVSGSVVSYLRDELGKFQLAQSIASVISETIANMERVAETKFVNLALIALTELGGSSDVTSAVYSLGQSFDQMQQPLIALMNASRLRGALETLTLASEASKAAFRYERGGTWGERLDAFDRQRSALLGYLFLSQVWGCMVLRRILCVAMTKRGSQLLAPGESATLVQRILSLIQDRLSSATPRGNMATVSTISALASRAVVLPSLCDDQMDYSEVYETGVVKGGLLSNEEVSEPLNAGGIDDFMNYVASVKRIVDTAAVNTFDEFTRHMVLSCNFGSDFDVAEFISFVEGCKTLKGLYKRLLVDINAKSIFSAMLVASLEGEGQSQEHGAASTAAVLADVKPKLANLESGTALKFRELAGRAVRATGDSCLEALKLGNIVTVQNALANETWDDFDTRTYAVEQGEVQFALVKSCAMIDERLDLYLVLAEALPSTGESASQDCIQLMELYHSLMDTEASNEQSAEAERGVNIRRSCLWAEALRYFSHRVSDVVNNTVNAMSAAAETDAREHALSTEDLSVRCKSLYGAAQKCSDNLQSLRQRILQTVVNEVSNEMVEPLTEWALQSADAAYDDKGLKDMIQVVQKSVDVIAEVLKDQADVQTVFEMAFQQMHTAIPREKISEERKEDFRDSCSELITELSHNACIKLQIFSLADTLSNELFS
ncbi:TelA-like protein [Babesia caballi]|uniref:TelA-like protein n=1 Tax=Babesia caballi TaxID=5871 RepID=A0AAV4LQY8_BABCB|nr:TelA-like protein [Babesia caballi]